MSDLLSITDPAELAKPWAPWTPQVGDRVRVRLSGECQIVYPKAEQLSGEILEHGLGHSDAENGAVGVVLAPRHELNSATHTIHVGFHEWVPAADGVPMHASYYAAAELEPLEPQP